MKHFAQKCLVCILLLSFTTLLLLGCGGPARPKGLPPLYRVSLKVMQEGEPLADAVVALQVSEGSLPWACGGTTDADGVAVLWTHGKFKGAPAGKFKVTVSKFVNEGEKEMMAAADKHDYATANKIPVNSFTFVKPEYDDMAKTPIEIEITDESQVIEVDAGPKVKDKRPYMRPTF